MRTRVSIRRIVAAIAVGVVAVGLAFASFGESASGQEGVCPDGTTPPCRPSEGEGEAAANRLSFPVIFPDGKPGSWVEADAWAFAPLASTTQCTTGVPDGTSVPSEYLCYWDGAKVWWLQQRAENTWQAYDPVLPAGSTLAVTAVDIGDLLESAPTIRQKQVRTEFTLLQRADTTLLGVLGAQLFTQASIGSFDWASQPVFAAMSMSGAVPGTDQSINEIQGTDYGASGVLTSTGVMIDPRTVKTDSVTGEGFDATVYSSHAMLVIQRVTGDDTSSLTWNATANKWVGNVSDPFVSISAADGTYSAEINAGGSLIYGYNWNTVANAGESGTYRLTFVLDAASNADFAGTLLVNPGEANPSAVASVAGDGLAYVDVTVVAMTTTGGPGGGNGVGPGGTDAGPGTTGGGPGGPGGSGGGGGGGR